MKKIWLLLVVFSFVFSAYGNNSVVCSSQMKYAVCPSGYKIELDYYKGLKADQCRHRRLKNKIANPKCKSKTKCHSVYKAVRGRDICQHKL